MNSLVEAGGAAGLKRRLHRSYFVKGITIAVLSGMCYGVYSAFVTKGMGLGAWEGWYEAHKAGIMVLMLGALGSAVNDSISAVWCIIMASLKGKIGDFARCLRSKPGRVMILCALAGGPVASTAYLVALQMAGSIIIPITALCPAIGAILGRFIFRQKLTSRMLVGVFICVGASIMIGSVSFGEEAASGTLAGCLIALIAAFGWGVEGCIAGFGTTLIDYEIGITIRQTTSGLSNLVILLPIVSLLAGDIGLAPGFVGAAFSDGAAMPFFVISGFFALFAFSLWYKGNSMCGAALGMACNGAYSFWGPFFCWIILGLFFKEDGWMIAPIAWVGAVVMFFGILLIAINPFAPLMKRKKEEGQDEITA
jgi:drug/metabolite transporter (DMT)-like permease